jgi:FG-GAP repeat protein
MRSALAILTLMAVHAAAAPLPNPLDLRSLTPAQGMVILGPQAGDQIGWSVSSAGDFNGDGRPDLLVGSPFARDSGSGLVTGMAHVVFGTDTPPGMLDLNALGSGGMEIRGGAEDDQLGRAVACIGDWNGDGLDDIAVGAPFAGSGPTEEVGEVWVLFGRLSPPATMDLSALSPSEGVRIRGAAAGDQTGFAVSPAGDWNADGLPDLAIGAPNADFGAVDAGRAYVLFGTVSPEASIELAVLDPAMGTIIDGASDSETDPVINLFGDSLGLALAGGHDLTGDGIDDLLINAPAADTSADNAGVTYLIEGAVSPEESIDLAGAPPSVHTLTGVDEEDQDFLVISGSFNAFFGALVASPGDLDADGVADIVIASHFADPAGDQSGEAYVIRGRDPFPLTLPLGAPGPQDWLIQGEAAGDLTGQGLAGARDFNGDGVVDLALGAPTANPLGRVDAGTVTALFGTALPWGDIALPDAGLFGLQILGDLPGELSGFAVAGVGDWNGDGTDDLAITAPGGGGNLGRSGAGVVYVVFGGEFFIELTGIGGWSLYR